MTTPQPRRFTRLPLFRWFLAARASSPRDWDISSESNGRVRLAVGTLYGALDRLSSGGLIELDHEEVVDGRPRRYYGITDDGTRAVTQEAERMRQAAEIVIRRTVRGTGTAPA